MRSHMRSLALIAVTAAASSTAVAQEAADPKWHVTISPYVWGKSLEGKVQAGGLSSPVDVPLSEAFETLENVFMGEVSVDGPRWGAYLDYQATDNLEEHEAFGLPLQADLRMRSLTAAAYYVAHEEELGGRTVHDQPRLFRISPLIGARWTKTRVDLSAPGPIAVGKQAEWTDIFVGFRANADISPRWTVSGHLDVGGFDPGQRFSLNAHTYLGYRTTLLKRPALLRVGYALLFQEHEQGDFTGDRFVWNMTQRGPVIGASITF